jgi:hypothetical protein
LCMLGEVSSLFMLGLGGRERQKKERERGRVEEREREGIEKEGGR